MPEHVVDATEEKPGEIVVEIASTDERTGAKPLLSDEDVEKLAEPPSGDEIGKYAQDAQKRIKGMHQANQEWKRRVLRAQSDVATATNLAQQLYNENQALRTNVGRSEAALVEQAIQRADAMLVTARNNFKNARAAQDIDAEAKAQEDIARYVSESERLRLLKPSAAGVESAEPPAAAAPAAPAAPAAQPKPKVTEATKAWVDRNPWFNDPEEDKMRDFAMSVHARLARQGVTELTDPVRYFGEIDKNLREVFPQRFKGKETPEDGQQPQPRTGHRPVAVVGGQRTGATQNGNGNGKRHITLSESQVRIAKGLGLTPVQYAEQLVKEQIEGKVQ
jgi:hypothetical protein